MKKTLQILNGIATVATIAMGYVSNTEIFNGNTMSSVSAEYQNLFTPSGYAFSIWGLIYLGMIGFVIYYGRSLFKKQAGEDDRTVEQIGWWFVISCVANSLWIVMWLYKYTLISVLLMLVLLISLLRIVVITKMKLQNATFKKLLFLWWPFSFYSGWVSVALIANIAAYLTKIGWDGFGISQTLWTVIMIVVATSVHLFMIWNRNMREFAMVLVWSLIAIAIANQSENLTVVFTAFVMAILVFINIAIHWFLNRKSQPFLQIKV